MSLPPRHRNVTLKRLLLDAWQYVRAQAFIARRFGRQYAPSRENVEIDITYRCNLKCFNCNRSCTQAPSRAELPVATIAGFLEESLDHGVQWKRIRLLGGEPTLHSRIFEIVDLLSDYQAHHNPDVRLVLGTNFHGRQVRRVLARLPENVVLKSTLKTSRKHLFRPFNMAPCDSAYYRWADFSCGCRIIAECGLGLTPSGYYMCAIAGGINRIFPYNLGRRRMIRWMTKWRPTAACAVTSVSGGPPGTPKCPSPGAGSMRSANIKETWSGGPGVGPSPEGVLNN